MLAFLAWTCRLCALHSARGSVGLMQLKRAPKRLGLGCMHIFAQAAGQKSQRRRLNITAVVKSMITCVHCVHCVSCG